MTTDPNADLIGYTFDHELGRARVTGSASWSSAYVALDFDNGSRSTMRADLVRKHKFSIPPTKRRYHYV